MSAIKYPFPTYLVDTSVIARRELPSVEGALSRLRATAELCTCAPLMAEICYSARDAKDYQRLRNLMENMIFLSSDDHAEEAALAAQRKLAESGRHRTSVVDLFVAATAAAHGAVVLHYDSDFERIGEVLGAQTQWVVPRGSV
jgi:predicted nucleic acid-binding protein